MAGKYIDWSDPVNKDHPLNRGLVAWYLAGEANPYWGGPKFRNIFTDKYHGSLTNMAAGATSGWKGPQGRPGGYGSIFLDGTNDYVEILKQLIPSGSFTLGISFRMVTLPGATVKVLVSQGSVAIGRNISLHVLSTGALAAFTEGGSTELTGPSLTAAIWYQATLMYNGTTATLYTNGVSSTSLAQTASYTGDRLSIGMSPSGNTATAVNALVDDLFVYNRALSGDEVAQRYSQSRRGHPETLRWMGRSQSMVSETGIFLDSTSNSGYQAAQSTYSWSHTCSGNSRYLSVDVGILSVPGTTVTSITYNSVALSLIGAQSTGAGAGRIECWGLANPATGSNTIAVTLSASVASAGVAVSYVNVHQTSPTEAFNSATAINGAGADDATVNITTVANNDWVHGAVATLDGSVTANQTSRNNVSGAAGSAVNEDSGPKTPAGAVTMSCTGIGAFMAWTIGAYGLRPVAAASVGGVIPQPYYPMFLGGIVGPL